MKRWHETGRGELIAMDTWRRHFPITSFVLQALLTKALAPDSELTREERILYTACEFWAAVAARELMPLLGSTPGRQLLLFAAAFDEIGAVRTASAIRNSIVEFNGVQLESQLRRVNLALEARLLSSDESVDAEIARFAIDRVATTLTLGEPIGTARHPQ